MSLQDIGQKVTELQCPADFMTTVFVGSQGNPGKVQGNQQSEQWVFEPDEGAGELGR